MKNSEILTRVRNRIKVEVGPKYICFQLEDIIYGYYTSPSDSVKARQLRDWVRTLLGSFSTYECWLSFYHPGKFKKWVKQGYPVVARVQWLDWMIKHWEAQGN